ncbi:MAG: phosphoribosylglycinamide formyltransferase [Myxococcota bacterium]|nr:phosphoribosylglycinamide formyltransferase [Myxococcota bacterium]
MRPRVAILISGCGSNMAAILDCATREAWEADFCIVLSNRPDAPGLDLAAERGVPTAVINHRNYRGRREEFDAALAERLRSLGTDWVVLAGFMRVLGGKFTEAFAGRILNIHPSLLPLYPGLNTHQRALEAGDSIAGCTVHLVDESLDGGTILAQAQVPIRPGDDPARLAARVLEEEHKLYPRVVRALIEGRLPSETASPDVTRGTEAEIQS